MNVILSGSQFEEVKDILNEIFKKKKYHFLVLDFKRSIISSYNQKEIEGRHRYISDKFQEVSLRSSEGSVEIHQLDLRIFMERFIQKAFELWMPEEMNVLEKEKEKEKIISSSLKEIFPFCVFFTEKRMEMIIENCFMDAIHYHKMWTISLRKIKKCEYESSRIKILEEDIPHFFVRFWNYLRTDNDNVDFTSTHLFLDIDGEKMSSFFEK